MLALAHVNAVTPRRLRASLTNSRENRSFRSSVAETKSVRQNSQFSTFSTSALPAPGTDNENDDSAREAVVMTASTDESASLRPSLLAPIRTMALFAAVFLVLGFGGVDEALAARSGGRMGGSRSFSSSRMRAAPPRAAAGGGAGGVRVNNYYAPPLISPYGMGGYGMGGMIMPFPVFGLGGLFNVMLLLFMVNVAVSVVQGFTNGGDKGKDERREDDGKDDRW